MRRGFTAIELAVVIVIITIVALMLAPTVERSRQKAMELKCLARVRQIGFACSMYQGDNEQRWPFARRSVHPDHSDWPDPTASLAEVYPEYAPKVYLFRCPSTEDLVNFNQAGNDFLHAENFFVSPEGEPTREEAKGKRPPAPPSYFYDATKPGIPTNGAPYRVVYGDECVHGTHEENGRTFWLGENNHEEGGNFLFLDKRVEWLPLRWTGAPYDRGESSPYVYNPHGEDFARKAGEAEYVDKPDTNVFDDDPKIGRREVDADLAGMMWVSDQWKEF